MSEELYSIETIRELLVDGVRICHILTAVEEAGFYTRDRHRTLVSVRPTDTGEYKSKKRSLLKQELCRWLLEEDKAQLGDGSDRTGDLINRSNCVIDHCGWPPSKLPRFECLRDLWKKDVLNQWEDADFDGRTSGKKPRVKRTKQQEQAIISWLKNEGYNPKALPRFQGIKAMATQALLKNPQLFTKSSFKHAWEQLRKSGAITDEIANKSAS